MDGSDERPTILRTFILALGWKELSRLAALRAQAAVLGCAMHRAQHRRRAERAAPLPERGDTCQKGGEHAWQGEQPRGGL